MIANIAPVARRRRPLSVRPKQQADHLRGFPAQDSRAAGIKQALEDLHEAGRHSVRIVDLDCGAGCLLIHAARYARALGFTAVEGRGIDGVPQLIGRARAAAARLHEPAIGLSFDVEDVGMALEHEAEFPADIVLWRRSLAFEEGGMLQALRRCGRHVLIDDGACSLGTGRRG
ncbi:SAM-dependent methyltransferase [Sphingomonas sp. S2-65]|uniref:SAM-dependent methyltransferase n=1 Tax=Sphingomonas sp. S2-65 TaxID=2903960 RepID=UPI001F230A74|nr:SAM-dependent methyltransferase [Sphingomonas sp. S2-65]UYY59579.1 SAM-dependent methyltransferase [Sphingomonas sp. S2-65]